MCALALLAIRSSPHVLSTHESSAHYPQGTGAGGAGSLTRTYSQEGKKEASISLKQRCDEAMAELRAITDAMGVLSSEGSL